VNVWTEPLFWTAADLEMKLPAGAQRRDVWQSHCLLAREEHRSSIDGAAKRKSLKRRHVARGRPCQGQDAQVLHRYGMNTTPWANGSGTGDSTISLGVGSLSIGTTVLWAKAPAAIAVSSASVSISGSAAPRRAEPDLTSFNMRMEDYVAVRFQKNVGMLLLAIWLILYGLAGMVGLGLPAPLMAVLALLAGVLLLVGR
jgi:hypothetical protein